MAILSFDMAEIRKQYEFTRAATSHKGMYSGDPVPAFWLVKDEGIYIMSSANPGMPHPTKPSPSVAVVYAKGYDPTKGDVYDKCRDAVGGDDFAESIPIAGMERIFAKADLKEFKVRITKTKFEVTAK